jgi:signal transduction histidine kinase
MWTLQTYLRRLIWVCMAPLLVLGLVALGFDLRSEQAQRDQDLQQRAQLIRQYVELRLRTEARALTVLASSLEQPNAASPAGFYRQIQAFRANFGDHVILAREGQMLMNTRVPLGTALPAMPEVKGRSAVDVALATCQPAVGDLVDGPVSKSLLLPVVVPVLTPGQATGLVLLATIEVDSLLQRLQQMTLPVGAHFWLLDSTGRTIAASDPTAPLMVPVDMLGRRIELPLELARWSLVVQTDGLAARSTLLRSMALWLIALAAGAAAAYWAAQRAGRSLGDGFKSLATPSAASLPQQDIMEIAHTRERLLQLNHLRDQQQAELRQLLTQIGHTQELERKRIALDIHDDLQQKLASLKLSATALGKADQNGQQALRRELAQAIADQATQAVQSTRRIIDDLRPQVLDDLGLEAALESLMERFERETGVEATFEAVSADGGELSVAPALAITLYRVAQEALNNVRKHAHAQTVALQLRQFTDGHVELRVVDDGQGLPPPRAPGSPGAGTDGVDGASTAPARGAAAGSGLGLAGMRERMRAVGGTLELRQAEGGGTEVVARTPMGSGPAA